MLQLTSMRECASVCVCLCIQAWSRERLEFSILCCSLVYYLKTALSQNLEPTCSSFAGRPASPKYPPISKAWPFFPSPTPVLQLRWPPAAPSFSLFLLFRCGRSGLRPSLNHLPSTRFQLLGIHLIGALERRWLNKSVTSTGCSSQHPCVSSQPSVTPVPREPVPLSGLTYIHGGTHTYIKNKKYIFERGWVAGVVVRSVSKRNKLQKKDSFSWAREMVTWARPFSPSLTT